ncbi:hypothetical protein BU25DRAFT_418126 [Macroventuria anomochaeta]|uniref:Uncharacterized protein n=1 Tax=Macroventuria anomochaeta TaxID=301207 RepID=A0ACB6SE03_9PLEO|nr:uncharacterized protein BU25DRAFT_418126 [Macroventuria anomochaeta]KAF2632446.1 hypothetical protein BU25DRAFT_418126 [Macroventuria anomochaeta]
MSDHHVLPVPCQKATKHVWSTAPHNFLKSYYQIIVLAPQDNPRIYRHDTHAALLIQVLAVYMPSKGLCTILPSMPSLSRAYDRVSNAIFKSKDWLTSDSAKDTDIVLIGVDLDILSGITTNGARPHLMLAAFDRRSDLQYEDDFLCSSLHGSSLGLEEHQLEYQLEHLTLVVSRLDVPEVLGQDFCYLFSSREQGYKQSVAVGEIQRKRFELYARRTSVDGPITQIQNI